MTRRIFYGFLLGTALAAASVTTGQAATELRPSEQWLVNSAGVQGLTRAGDTQAPCIMANQYNNGFILRMAGGGGKILSLSVDFRQDVFDQGTNYPASLSIDGGQIYNISASAFSPSILIFSADDAAGLYDQVQAGRTLVMNLNGQTIAFSLERSADGLRRLENCYGQPGPDSAQQRIAAIPTARDTEVYIKRESGGQSGIKQPTAQSMMKARSVPPVSSHGMTDLPPLSAQEMAELNVTPDDLSAYDDGGPGMRLAGAPPSPTAMPTNAPSVPRVDAQSVMAPAGPPTDIMPRTSSAGAVQAAQWQAEAGEDIRAVLSRWAARDGRDLVWQADKDGGRIARDIAVNGPFEEAVAQVMADNAAALGIRSQFAQGQAMTGSAAMNAQAGDNLQQVLQRWAAQNNVALTWNATEQFTLNRPVNGQGDFAAAIEAALTQFDDQSVRPVGQLNRDPLTGRLSLTIETDRTT